MALYRSAWRACGGLQGFVRHGTTTTTTTVSLASTVTPLSSGLRPMIGSASKPFSLLSVRGVATATPGIWQADDVRLNNLRDNEGANRPRKRVGRGQGSGRGGTSGRGHKGHRSRAGKNVAAGFEGGQTPLIKRLKKFGFSNAQFKVEYETINLNRIQYFIDSGRLDPKNVITVKTLKDSGLISSVRKKKMGVKLLSNGKEWFSSPINIEVQQCSAVAREAVEKAGGTVTTVYFNRLGLRTFMKKDFEDIHIRFARVHSKKEVKFDLPRYIPPHLRGGAGETITQA
eukprot:TRINITY_DN10881_c0_g1_i1.p1 TRINITY_DN10881_c0_g1~~TRINITY_DN10881_c0_g1_i1.p1  ORF type:complete len:286 (-),score=66.25 TRINITY_DN10881_c0_g1_i1:45-902(-)